MGYMPSDTSSGRPQDEAPPSMPPGYRILAEGWDSYAEALDIELDPALFPLLQRAKQEAAAADQRAGGVAWTDCLGGMPLQIRATGASGGWAYSLSNPAMTITIREAENIGFPVLVRYSSEGLWRYGLDTLRSDLHQALEYCGTPRNNDWQRVSMAHYCLDFLAPELARDMVFGAADHIVSPARSKRSNHGTEAPDSEHGHGRRLETLTCGSKSGCQWQLYDKPREIENQSDKRFMFQVWANELGFSPIKPYSTTEWRWDFHDVWRFETRFSGDYLKERDCNRPAALAEHLPTLLRQAWTRSRWTRPNGDSNRARWPMHPVFEAAITGQGTGPMASLGRTMTGTRQALVKTLQRSLAGQIRAMVTLCSGEWDAGMVYVIMDGVLDIIKNDTKHAIKVANIQERYRWLDF